MLMELDHIIDYFDTFKKWIFTQIFYTEKEHKSAAIIQRTFRNKMYIRRCKASQTTETFIQTDQEWVL